MKRISKRSSVQAQNHRLSYIIDSSENNVEILTPKDQEQNGKQEIKCKLNKYIHCIQTLMKSGPYTRTNILLSRPKPALQDQLVYDHQHQT